MTETFSVRIEWLEAPDVSTPELATTWARYEVWAGDRCVTQVEGSDGTLRRSVYGSLYPLAEWIATNWWVLTTHSRPSAVEAHYWSWPNLLSYPWLRNHNFRAAGDGMSWPNLTLVPEGNVTCLHWSEDRRGSLGRVRFASSGSVWSPSETVVEGLANVVTHVLERLAEAGLPKTNLAEEWAALSATDSEERAFCQTVARLGLDPYSIDDGVGGAVITAVASLPRDVIDDFFDSVDPTSIKEGTAWVRRAEAAAGKAAARADKSLADLYEAARQGADSADELTRPWHLGYAMARAVREALGVDTMERFDVAPWVGTTEIRSSSSGIQGYASVDHDRCGLVVGLPSHAPSTKLFRQARTLGRVLSAPEQSKFLLSGARGYNERVAGAFAAELLAPAEGIRRVIRSIGEYGDWAIDDIARQFNVSPLVVRHQYDNQVAIDWARG